MNQRTFIAVGLLFSLFLAVALLRNILFSPGVVLYGDMTWAIIPELNKLPFYSWQFQMSAPQVGSSMAPLYLFLSLNVEVMEKILLASTLFVLSFSGFFSVYFLTRKYTETKYRLIACLASATLMVLNPFVYGRFLGQLSMALGFGLAPLVLVLFIRCLENDHHWKRYAVLGSVCLSVASINLHAGLWNILLLFSYLLYDLFVARRPIKETARTLVKLLLFFSIFIALSAYWLIPAVMSSSKTSHPFFAYTIDSLKSLSGRTSLINSVRLFGMQFNTAVDTAFYSPNSLLILTFVPALFSFAAILLKPKDKYVVFFTLLLPILLFLSQGSQGPFGSFYSWLTFNSPLSSFGWLFRDSNRAIGLVFGAYSFLSAVTLYEVCTRISKFEFSKKVAKVKLSMLNSHKILAAIAVICVFFASLFIPMGQMVQGNFSGGSEKIAPMTPVLLPEEYTLLNDWLRNQTGAFKVIWMPYDRGQFEYIWNNEASISNFPAFISSRSSFYETYSGIDASRFLSYMYYGRLLQNKSTSLGKIISIADMKYVIFHKDYLNYSSFRNDDAESVYANLNAQLDLTKTWVNGSLSVFKNNYPVDPIYIPSRKMAVVGGIDSYFFLNNFEAFNPKDWAITYFEQPSQLNLQQLKENDVLLFFNKDYSDLLFSLVDKKELIKVSQPADPKNLTQNPYSGWASYAISAADVLQSWGYADNGISSNIASSFDYGQGYIFTFEPLATIQTDFITCYSDNYGLWARVIMNKNAGNITFSIDGIPYSINAYSEVDNGYTWVNISNVSLQQGSHNLRIINQNGNNTINVLAAVPVKEFPNLVYTTKNILRQFSHTMYAYEKENLEVQHSQILKNIMTPRSNCSLTIQTSAQGIYTVEVDGVTQEFTNQTNLGSYWVYHTQPFCLSEGEHSMKITSSNYTSLRCINNLILLSSVNQTSADISQFFRAKESTDASIIDSKIIDPVTLVVNTNASKPFTLILPESYDSFWSLNANGQEYSPFPVYSFLNGFDVNETGILTITISYKLQHFQNVCFYVSEISFLFAASYLCLPLFRFSMKKWRVFIHK